MDMRRDTLRSSGLSIAVTCEPRPPLRTSQSKKDLRHGELGPFARRAKGPQKGFVCRLGRAGVYALARVHGVIGPGLYPPLNFQF
jgi:hypothetical protein